MGPNSFAQKFTHYPTITIRFASLSKLINQSNSRITGELPVASKLGNYSPKTNPERVYRRFP